MFSSHHCDRRSSNHNRSQRHLTIEPLEQRQLLAADGVLDSTFSGNGYDNVDIESTDQGEAVAVQPDGRIVVAGRGNAASNFALVRYLPNGDLDTTFGERGKVQTNFSGVDGAHDLVIDAQGRIIVVGGANGVNHGQSQNYLDFGIARYTHSGILDKTFGEDGTGKVRISSSKLGGGWNEAFAVDICRWGRHAGTIVVAGQGKSMNDMVLVRLTSNGRLDPTFAGNGIVVQHFEGRDGARDVAVDASGNIVVVGFVNGMNDQAVARFTAEGKLDESFGEGGSFGVGGLHKESYAGTGVANAVTLRAGGKILVVGQGNGMGDITMFQLDTNGDLDPSFGRTDVGAGIYSSMPGRLKMNIGGTDGATDVAIQHDGKIVIVGGSNGDVVDIEFQEFRFVKLVAVRFNSDGSLDRSFADAGQFNKTLGGPSSARAVAIQRDGKIVIGGDGNGNADMMVARLDVSPPTGEIYDEYDDTMSYAIELAPGQRLIRTVGDRYDDDWFSFRLSAASHFTLNASLDAHSVELTALLYRDYVDIWSDGAYVPGGTMTMEFDLAPGVYQLQRQPCDPGTTFTLEFGAASLGAELWQNPERPEDVDHDGQVAPLDALIVINRLGESGPLPVLRSEDNVHSVDVDGNNLLSPLDALIVINQLGKPAHASAVQTGPALVPAGTADGALNSIRAAFATAAVLGSASTESKDPTFNSAAQLDATLKWDSPTPTSHALVADPNVEEWHLADELDEQLVSDIGDNWSAERQCLKHWVNDQR